MGLLDVFKKKEEKKEEIAPTTPQAVVSQENLMPDAAVVNQTVAQPIQQVQNNPVVQPLTAPNTQPSIANVVEQPNVTAQQVVQPVPEPSVSIPEMPAVQQQPISEENNSGSGLLENNPFMETPTVQEENNAELPPQPTLDIFNGPIEQNVETSTPAFDVTQSALDTAAVVDTPQPLLDSAPIQTNPEETFGTKEDAITQLVADKVANDEINSQEAMPAPIQAPEENIAPVAEVQAAVETPVENQIIEQNNEQTIIENNVQPEIPIQPIEQPAPVIENINNEINDITPVTLDTITTSIETENPITEIPQVVSAPQAPAIEDVNSLDSVSIAPQGVESSVMENVAQPIISEPQPIIEPEQSTIQPVVETVSPVVNNDVFTQQTNEFVPENNINEPIIEQNTNFDVTTNTPVFVQEPVVQDQAPIVNNVSQEQTPIQNIEPSPTPIEQPPVFEQAPISQTYVAPEVNQEIASAQIQPVQTTPTIQPMIMNQPMPERIKTRFCDVCGEMITDSRTTCPNCGTPLN